MTNNKDLLVPVYLNQRLVFDLIAMLQDGISQVVRVTSNATDAEDSSKQTIGTFGLGSALSSLLKVNLSSTGTQEQKSTTAIERSEDRVHTPASLLFKLHRMLSDRSYINIVNESTAPQHSEIVEFSTTLRRNSLLLAIDTLAGVTEISEVFSNNNTQSQSSGKRQKLAPSGNSVIIQMRKFREQLVTGGTIDMVSDVLPGGYRSLVTLESEFLRDPTMSDLVDGRFRVIGKVIRVINDNSDAISLIRKTHLGAMPIELIKNAFSHLDSLIDNDQWRLPKMEWDIKGPVFQIIPIAIYA